MLCQLKCCPVFPAKGCRPERAASLRIYLIYSAFLPYSKQYSISQTNSSLVKTVLGKELGATGVGSYAALLIVCAHHNTACFFQLIVVLLCGKLFYGVLGCVEGKGFLPLAVRFPTFTVKAVVVAAIFLGTHIVTVEAQARWYEKRPYKLA